MADRFPILLGSHRRTLGLPEGVRLSVPWAMLAPHEEQALRNHDQSLQRLADRGGLDPCEMLAVLDDVHWRHRVRMPIADAWAELQRRVAAFEGGAT